MEAVTTPAPSREDPAVDDVHIRRLAEMVQHLTECAPGKALHAIERAVRTAPTSADDALTAVAHAMVAVKRGNIDLRDQIQLD